jgi:small subunit ribosomal protein S20
MANIRSAAKQARKSSRRRLVNQQAKDALRAAAKQIKGLVKDGKKDEAIALLSGYQSQVDKAAKVGRVKKNTASRRKSRIARLLKSGATAAPATKPKKAAAKKATVAKAKKAKAANTQKSAK